MLTRWSLALAVLVFGCSEPTPGTTTGVVDVVQDSGVVDASSDLGVTDTGTDDGLTDLGSDEGLTDPGTSDPGTSDPGTDQADTGDDVAVDAETEISVECVLYNDQCDLTIPDNP